MPLILPDKTKLKTSLVTAYEDAKKGISEDDFAEKITNAINDWLTPWFTEVMEHVHANNAPSPGPTSTPL